MSEVDVWMGTELTPSPRPSAGMHEQQLQSGRLSIDRQIRMHGMQMCRMLEAEQGGRSMPGQAQVPHAAGSEGTHGGNPAGVAERPRVAEGQAASHSFEPEHLAGESVSGEHGSGRLGIADQPRAAAAAAGSERPGCSQEAGGGQARRQEEEQQATAVCCEAALGV
jgi:hypothetical protein